MQAAARGSRAVSEPIVTLPGGSVSTPGRSSRRRPALRPDRAHKTRRRPEPGVAVLLRLRRPRSGNLGQAHTTGPISSGQPVGRDVAGAFSRLKWREPCRGLANGIPWQRAGPSTATIDPGLICTVIEPLYPSSGQPDGPLPRQGDPQSRRAGTPERWWPTAAE